MMKFRFYAPPCLLVAALCWLSAPERAEAAWSDALQEGLNAMRSTQQALREETQKAIVIGGVLLYRHRHAVAGAALGCVIGSMAGATTAAGAGLPTGGASLAGVAPAAALGCGLGALSGAAIGQPLDNVYDDQ
jgi:uncharacterized protein YcfJ